MGKIKRIDLVENGDKVLVTNENKKEYVKKYAYSKMALETEIQTKALLKGINEIIPEDIFKNFNEKDLAFILSGKPTINSNINRV
jgi:hypothetical protein